MSLTLRIAQFWDAAADSFDEEADHGLRDQRVRGMGRAADFLALTSSTKVVGGAMPGGAKPIPRPAATKLGTSLESATSRATSRARPARLNAASTMVRLP
jgi:hypothetical protein